MNIKSWVIDGDIIRHKRVKKIGLSNKDIQSNHLEIV